MFYGKFSAGDLAVMSCHATLQWLYGAGSIKLQRYVHLFGRFH